nr:type IV pilin protein [uncultured Roseateles sp.]
MKLVASSAASPVAPQRGFSLVELMIVVGIIGILSAVALPAYNDYVRRGQLPEATSALSDYRVKMEQFYQDNRNYGTGTCATGASWGNFVRSGSKYFTYACALSNSGQGFTVTATGAAGSAIGHEYTVDHNGAMATTKFKGSSSTKACWLIKGDEC